MSSGEVIACHYLTSQPLRLTWHKGRIAKIEPTNDEVCGIYLAPPMLDLQVNGYGGVDFQSDAITSDDLLMAVRKLRRDGCAQIFLTLVTAEWPVLMQRLQRLRKMRESSAELQSAIAGWHLEGPFMSPEPGFHGAHPPALMIDPTPTHFQELRHVAGNDRVLVTLSPERSGAIESIRVAVGLGITISLGHTNAPAATLKDAVKAGATSFTHLANGCPQQLDRHDNILWRVFETPGLTVGVIPDCIHVSAPLFRIFHRLLNRTRIWYTTDAVAPAGSPPGRYKFGGLEIDVGADQVVRQPGKTNFAGSALTPIQGVLRSAQMLGCAWQNVWDNISEVPRGLVHMDNEWGVEQPADFCLLKTDESGNIASGSVYVNGEATELMLTSPVS
ncbi:MAG TPA: N-acetylglucosamine-6-phosphate deacetylase [Planctomycetota bacterium]|nr:N-acetylglucosamine-6-phosphate deacetylase [Planctomycetota bacterium]